MSAIPLLLLLQLLITTDVQAQCLVGSFDPNLNNAVGIVVVQPDGKILIGGGFIRASPNGGTPIPRYHLARLNPDGTMDMAFNCETNCNTNGVVNSIAVQADGKVLIGGSFTTVGGQPRKGIARLDATTGLVDSFDPNPNSYLESIGVQADGKILAGGTFTSIGGELRNRIARLDPTTGLADSFDPNPDGDSVTTIAVQPDGKILVGGYFANIGGQTRFFIARLDAATGLADSFNPTVIGPNPSINSIVVQPDGKILVGGDFITLAGQSRHRIGRLNPTTGLADSFNPNVTGSGWVLSIAVQADGKVWAGGLFSTVSGQPRSRIARLDALTGLVDSWNPNANATVESIAVQPDGKIIVGGSFTSMSGQTRNCIAQLDPACAQPTPSPTPSTPATTLGNISTRLPVEAGDNVLIGGFIVTGTQPKKIIVRAIGPSLPLAGTLVDPILELRDSFGNLLSSNDNWRSDGEDEIIATGIPPSNDLESAIVATLAADNSAYTAVVRGVNDGTGIGVVEAYDLDQTVDSKLANISTRGLVQTGDNVLIAGTIVLGSATQRVLVRALGPSLPVAGKLGNPTLELRDGSGTLIRANDNWRSDQEAEITATTIPPTDDLESAVIETLPANGAAYTAIVRGSDGTTGVAVVEVYALN